MKNAWSDMSEKTRKDVFFFSEEYMDFLDAAKTEREARMSTNAKTILDLFIIFTIPKFNYRFFVILHTKMQCSTG